MRETNRNDFEEKKRRVHEYLQKNGYSAMILGRRDNFAWFSFGGDNKLFRSMDIGFGLLVITMKQVYLVAQYMDSDRMMEDELPGLDIEQVTLKWFEQSREEKAVELAGGGRVVSDYPMTGADCKFREILDLHLPYTPWELERYREVGAINDNLYAQFAEAVHPGMTERQVEAMMLEAFGARHMSPKVLLVGSDERIAKYRHPSPSEKKIEKLLLIHAAADCFGMHANVTRMISFGDPDEKTEAAYECLNRCLASACSLLVPGRKHDAILEARKAIFVQEGIPQEFELHYPGATTGYYVGDPAAILENSFIRDTMCYDWFITMRGAKVEELCMARPGGAEVLSVTGAWPTKEYAVGDYRCRLPVILHA